MNRKCHPNVTHLIKYYKCDYCNQEYKYRQGLSRHLKTCVKKKNEDKELKHMQELVELLNEQLKEKDDLICRRDKQIQILIDKIGLNTTHNTIIQTNNQINNNIKLLGYRNTDYSHLTDEDYKQCISHCNLSIPHFIEKVHFNRDKPENHNIYISNLKNKYVMIFDGEKWIYKNRDQEIENLLDNGNTMLEYKLEEWLENGQKFPIIMKKFERYMSNIEKDEVLNMIKEEIKLLLFNNRELPKIQI